MRRPESCGTSASGVHHVAKIATSHNCTFHKIDQENDVGLDAFIELIVDQQTTGCWIGAQIKSGKSYIHGERFVVRSDEVHNSYWRSQPIPIAGIVYDPATDSARWVDITEHLEKRTASNKGYSIPATNAFDSEHFDEFKRHFLAYRESYSNERHFARALSALSRLKTPDECAVGLRALFSFHRNREEMWFYLLASLRYLRGHRELPWLIFALSHVPGHGDIFWTKENIIADATSEVAENLFRERITRDDVLVLLSVVDEVGFARGSIGQCVYSIIGIVADRYSILESIITDPTVPQGTRFWALLLLSDWLQHRDHDRCGRIITDASKTFTGDDAMERVAAMRQAFDDGEKIRSY